MDRLDNFTRLLYTSKSGTRKLKTFDTIYYVQRRVGLRATDSLHAMTASENTYSGLITNLETKPSGAPNEPQSGWKRMEMG